VTLSCWSGRRIMIPCMPFPYRRRNFDRRAPFNILPFAEQWSLMTSEIPRVPFPVVRFRSSLEPELVRENNRYRPLSFLTPFPPIVAQETPPRDVLFLLNQCPPSLERLWGFFQDGRTPTPLSLLFDFARRPSRLTKILGEFDLLPEVYFSNLHEEICFQLASWCS